MENFTETFAVPSLELYQIAKEKALSLEEGQQINLTEDFKTYTVLKFQGKHFIGTRANVDLKPFFSGRDIYEMKNTKGELTYSVQRLFKNHKPS